MKELLIIITLCALLLSNIILFNINEKVCVEE